MSTTEAIEAQCAGLEGCQTLEGVMHDLFVHDPSCPKGHPLPSDTEGEGRSSHWVCEHCGNTRRTGQKPDVLLCVTCIGSGHLPESCPACEPATDTQDTPKHLKLWICSKCIAPRLYGTGGGCYACGTLLHDTAEYHRDDQCTPNTATTEDAVAYLESINAPVTEDRILWAKFLATKPSVEQVNLASSLVVDDRKRHGEGLAEALREVMDNNELEHSHDCHTEELENTDPMTLEEFEAHCNCYIAAARTALAQ